MTKFTEDMVNLRPLIERHNETYRDFEGFAIVSDAELEVLDRAIAEYQEYQPDEIVAVRSVVLNLMHENNEYADTPLSEETILTLVGAVFEIIGTGYWSKVTDEMYEQYKSTPKESGGHMLRTETVLVQEDEQGHYVTCGLCGVQIGLTDSTTANMVAEALRTLVWHVWAECIGGVRRTH
jgi:hypothetical protein